MKNISHVHIIAERRYIHHRASITNLQNFLQQRHTAIPPKHCCMARTLVNMREKLKDAAMKYRLLKVGENAGNSAWLGVSACGIGKYVVPCNRNGKIQYRRPIKSTSRTSTNSRMGSPKPSQICPHCKGSGKLPHAADVVGNLTAQTNKVPFGTERKK